MREGSKRETKQKQVSRLTAKPNRRGGRNVTWQLWNFNSIKPQSIVTLDFSGIALIVQKRNVSVL